MKVNLVLIETSGNQNYIFATNKLRENVGASELTYRVGTQWMLEAVERVTKQKLWDEDTDRLRWNLLDGETRNPPIEKEKLPIEVILAASGKALLLVKENEDSPKAISKQIVREVTTRALACAPGLDVCGVISNDFEWETYPLGDAYRHLYEQYEAIRAKRPGPVTRFLRLPISAECATSGLPAREWHLTGEKDGMEDAPRSAVTIAKWEFRLSYKDRMKQLLQILAARDGIQARFRFADKIEDFDQLLKEMEERSQWLAVIHADGNGLGKIFLNFDRYAKCSKPQNKDHRQHNRDYADSLRRFSLALDFCTEQAFWQAFKQWVERDEGFWYKVKLPILPIVLGGDDLTVVCAGDTALAFTHDFLRAIEEQTAVPVRLREEDTLEEQQIIITIAQAALGAPRLSACAGVAVIKPHYPFSAAYEMAEDLLQSAKVVKKIVKKDSKELPCSALDFHLHYDSSGSDLERIREKLASESQPLKSRTQLYARPYVVSDLNNLDEATQGKEWAIQHHWRELDERVRALRTTDETDVDRRRLPNSQMHELREGLFLGRQAADARYRLIRHRYENQGIHVFDGDTAETLFERDFDPTLKSDEKLCHTKLLDALDAATIYEPAEKQKRRPQSAFRQGGTR